MNSNFITIDRASGIPLVGSLAFGIIDRGSSLIQVRPSSACNMKCTFCSTSANDLVLHPVNYTIDPDYLVAWVKEIATFKRKLHVNIDSVGEPMAYQHLLDLIHKLALLPEVYFISMQTNGTLLNEETIGALEKAGLRRIHLSLHSLDEHLSRKLFGNEHYSLPKVLHAVELLQSSKIEVLLAPVWLPKVNDKDIIALIQFAKKRSLRIAIQKYEVYRYSRKEKDARKTNFFYFYQQLTRWEREFGIHLVYHAKDLEVYPAPRLPEVFRVGEIVRGIVTAPGWMTGQMLCAAKNRSITVVHCNSRVGDRITVRVLATNHNIYLAEMVKNV